jgi:hypothetical protein
MTDPWRVRWDGTKPDDILRRIRQDVGPGIAACIWGGMSWDFRVFIDGQIVEVNYGDWLVVDPAAGTVRVVRDAAAT